MCSLTRLPFLSKGQEMLRGCTKIEFTPKEIRKVCFFMLQNQRWHKIHKRCSIVVVQKPNRDFTPRCTSDSHRIRQADKPKGERSVRDISIRLCHSEATLRHKPSLGQAVIQQSVTSHSKAISLTWNCEGGVENLGCVEQGTCLRGLQWISLNSRETGPIHHSGNLISTMCPMQMNSTHSQGAVVLPIVLEEQGEPWLIRLGCE